MVAIPTDVLQVSNHKFHPGKMPFASCAVNGQELVRGSACCSLSATPTGPPEYLLGCHHVFMASEMNANLSPGPVAYVACNQARIGGIYKYGQMNASPSPLPSMYSNDAALAFIEDAGNVVLETYWTQRWYPANLARTVPQNIPVGGGYGVYCDGGSVPANFIGRFLNWTIDLQNGFFLQMPDVLVYDTGGVTEQGDSGSPFYDQSNGTLLGMHFAGYASTSTPSGFVSVAESAWHLTSADGRFKMDIYLVR